MVNTGDAYAARRGVPGRARLVLYVLLLLAAAATLFAQPLVEQGVREGRWPRGALMASPALLALFVAMFATYRFALVRTGRYHAGKAFVQVGLMLLVLTLALPGSLDRWRAAGTQRAVDLERHLASGDPETRALAAELARHRDPADARRYVPRLLDLLDDSSPEVRRQARASLIALAGGDRGGGEGREATARWRAWWKSEAGR